MNRPVDSGTARSIAIADELSEAYQADTDLVRVIEKVRNAKLTNIGRLFSGVTLTRMQLSIRRDEARGVPTLWARHTADQLHAYFSWAFGLLDSESVDAFKNDTLRNELLDDHLDLVPADSLPAAKRLADRPYSHDPGDKEPASDGTGDSQPHQVDDETTHDDTDEDTHSDASRDTSDRDSGAEGQANGGRRREPREERVLYSAVRLTNLSGPVRRLLKEARDLPINDNYAVACVLARVILELAVSEPQVLAKTGKRDGSPLAEKITGAILALDPNAASRGRTRPELSQAYAEATNIGVTYLHQFIHNPVAVPAPQVARHFSAVFTPLLNAINEELA